LHIFTDNSVDLKPKLLEYRFVPGSSECCQRWTAAATTSAGHDLSATYSPSTKHTFYHSELDNYEHNVSKIECILKNETLIIFVLSLASSAGDQFQ